MIEDVEKVLLAALLVIDELSVHEELELDEIWVELVLEEVAGVVELVEELELVALPGVLLRLLEDDAELMLEVAGVVTLAGEVREHQPLAVTVTVETPQVWLMLVVAVAYRVV